MHCQSGPALKAPLGPPLGPLGPRAVLRPSMASEIFLEIILGEMRSLGIMR